MVRSNAEDESDAWTVEALQRQEKDSWVFHIFKMLQHIDVGQADATNPDDYNKSLSYEMVSKSSGHLFWGTAELGLGPPSLLDLKSPAPSNRSLEAL